jgi:hypothetical protein
MHYTQVFNDEEIAEIEREQMPEQPKKPPTPTFEDILRELGPEKMSFTSEMLRPDAEDEREGGDEQMPPATPTSEDPEHQQAIIERLEKYFGRKPTQQEINLALKQARLL